MRPINLRYIPINYFIVLFSQLNYSNWLKNKEDYYNEKIILFRKKSQITFEKE